MRKGREGGDGKVRRGGGLEKKKKGEERRKETEPSRQKEGKDP